MRKFWVITESMTQDGGRFIAFPATEETLQDVISIAKISAKTIYVAEEYVAQEVRKG
jgi:hypothetical protein